LICKKWGVTVLPSNPPWAEPYLEYLTNNKLPEDEVQKRQIERRAKAYNIIDGQLYKQSTSGVFMKCISQVDELKYYGRSTKANVGIMPPPDPS
jgi:hypothetical protein